MSKSKKKKIYEYSIEQFNKLKKLEDSNLNVLEKELINIIISATKKNRNRLIKELYFIKKYFNINKNSDKFDVEKIALELEKLIPDNIKGIDVPVQKEEDKKDKVEENKYAKILVNKFNDCYNYYKNNKKNKTEENYFEKLVNYFKEIFGDEKIKEFNSNDFTDNITKKIFILFYCQIIDFTNSSKNKLKNELQLIKDLFEILNIYRSINNDNLYSISENLKSLFPLILDRMSDIGNDIFKGLSEDIFPAIVEKDEL